MYIHHCPECGKQYSTQEKVNRVKCPYCGAETNVSYSDQQQFSGQPLSGIDSVFFNGPSGKSRGVAAILALFAGAFGLHYFYVGRFGRGLLCLFTCNFIGIGWILDILKILNGKFKDNTGTYLRQK